MKKLEIVYEGGYRQVSKYLTLEHDANFSLIIDAIINVYNMNLTKLVTIGRHRAVKVSNGFLSRQTGLGISIIKTNVKKIEEIGLITAIKKGQGNTRHYVINVENINSYIAALQPKFEQWFEKSLEASKKDKARSVEADDNKLKKNREIFATTIAKLATFTKESKIGLVENRPTQTVETDQPNRLKATVADTAKETSMETTTKKKNVVVKSSTNKNPVPRVLPKERNLTELANEEISDTNWDRLEQAYNNLPSIPNQGRFYTSKQDKSNFYTLTVAKQEYVIKSVVVMTNSNATASRPATYIEEAMKPRPKRISEPGKILNRCI